MNDRKNEIFDNPINRDVSPAGLSFEVPVIDVPLPSNGRVYPEGSPLHRKESILIQAMTTTQENILTNKSLAKRGTLMTHLIQSCLKDKAINARDMLIGDRSTVMVSLRISGYGPDYSVKVECPVCGETSVQTFKLNELPVRRLTLDPVEEGTNLFEFTLPVSRARVRFKFLTGADEEEIATAQAQKKKVGMMDGEMVTTGLLQTIVSINGVSDRSQIALALPRMPAFDSKAIRQHIQNHEPGMQLKGEMVCPTADCGYTGEVDMPLGANFFWPDSE